MKKLFGLIMSIFIVIALSACNKEEAQDTSDTSAQNNNVTQPENTVKEEDTGVFSSIKEALSKSISLKCLYTDKEGDSMTMYLKGNVMRVDVIKKQPTDPLISEVVKNNKIYMWSDTSDQGVLIDFAAIKPGEEYFKMDETTIKSTDDIINKVEEQKQNCVREIVSDSIFEVPANIKFLGETK
jgi:hypothetical protein